MDDFFRSLGHRPRRFPAPAPLLAAGHFAAKDHRVTKTYATCNASLILAGRGTYRHRGQVLPVEAPAVLTQWPGEANDYGPEGTWRELYLIFSAESEAHLRRLGLADRSRPLWRVAAAAPFLALAEDLLRHLRHEAPLDRLDRLAELVLVESALASAPPALDDRTRDLVALREAVDAGTITDPEAEARRRGLSPSTFRRHWLALVGVPPARYALEIRLREAARRLVDGDESIAAIAQDLGFADALYFSRRFRAFTGLPPTAYRARARHLAELPKAKGPRHE